MIVPHAEAREMPCITQRREALCLRAVLALRFFLLDVGAYQVGVVQGLREGVFRVAEKDLRRKAGWWKARISCCNSFRMICFRLLNEGNIGMGKMVRILVVYFKEQCLYIDPDVARLFYLYLCPLPRNPLFNISWNHQYIILDLIQFFQNSRVM